MSCDCGPTDNLQVNSIATGGDPTLYNASDTVPSIMGVSSVDIPTCMISRYYGASPLGGGPRFHFEAIGGTAASPTNPASGSIVLDEGARTYYDGTCAGSSLARIGYTTEDVTGPYPGAYIDYEGTKTGSGSRLKYLRQDHDGAWIVFGTAGDIGKSLSLSGSAFWIYGRYSNACAVMQSDNATTLYMNRNSSDGELLEARRSNATVGSLNVTSTGFSLNSTSDARLKSDLGAIESGSIIDAVAPHRFTWNSTGERDFGFFAQELNAAVPQAVTRGSDIGPGENGFRPWRNDQAKLVAILWAEVRSLRARLEKAGL